MPRPRGTAKVSLRDGFRVSPSRHRQNQYSNKQRQGDTCERQDGKRAAKLGWRDACHATRLTRTTDTCLKLTYHFVEHLQAPLWFSGLLERLDGRSVLHHAKLKPYNNEEGRREEDGKKKEKKKSTVK